MHVSVQMRHRDGALLNSANTKKDMPTYINLHSFGVQRGIAAPFSRCRRTSRSTVLLENSTAVHIKNIGRTVNHSDLVAGVQCEQFIQGNSIETERRGKFDATHIWGNIGEGEHLRIKQSMDSITGAPISTLLVNSYSCREQLVNSCISVISRLCREQLSNDTLEDIVTESIRRTVNHNNPDDRVNSISVRSPTFTASENSCEHSFTVAGTQCEQSTQGGQLRLGVQRKGRTFEDSITVDRLMGTVLVNSCRLANRCTEQFCHFRRGQIFSRMYSRRTDNINDHSFATP